MRFILGLMHSIKEGDVALRNDLNHLKRQPLPLRIERSLLKIDHIIHGADTDPSTDDVADGYRDQICYEVTKEAKTRS